MPEFIHISPAISFGNSEARNEAITRDSSLHAFALSSSREVKFPNSNAIKADGLTSLNPDSASGETRWRPLVPDML